MIPIVLGTRGSALAMAQTRLMRDALKKAWPGRTFEIHVIRTRGDKISKTATLSIEGLGKGLFTAELERALHEKKIHVAVHSLKDLPTDPPDGLTLAAIPKRGDARDVLITRGASQLSELPYQAQIATGSPRRTAQLMLARQDLRVVDIRGNIDSRVRKFRETAEWSGLVLAAAGLDRVRLNTNGLSVIPLPFEVMLPAPGQGALALQTRQGATDAIEVLKAIHDPVTALEVAAERSFLRALGGGCLEPVGAYARMTEDDVLHLDGVAWLEGDTTPRRGSLQRKASEAELLGLDLAVEISR